MGFLNYNDTCQSCISGLVALYTIFQTIGQDFILLQNNCIPTENMLVRPIVYIHTDL